MAGFDKSSVYARMKGAVMVTFECGREWALAFDYGIFYHAEDVVPAPCVFKARHGRGVRRAVLPSQKRQE